MFKELIYDQEKEIEQLRMQLQDHVSFLFLYFLQILFFKLIILLINFRCNQ